MYRQQPIRKVSATARVRSKSAETRKCGIGRANLEHETCDSFVRRIQNCDQKLHRPPAAVDSVVLTLPLIPRILLVCRPLTGADRLRTLSPCRPEASAEGRKDLMGSFVPAAGSVQRQWHVI